MLNSYRLCWSYLLVLAAVATVTLTMPANGLAQVRDLGAQARVHFERGNDLFESAMRSRRARRTQLLEEALEAYVTSLTVVRSRNVIFNAALTCEELGRLEEAFNYLAEYVATEGLSASDLTEGQRRIDNLRGRVAVIGIESNPVAAEVRLDRLDLPPLGSTPLQVAVRPGTHRVFLSAPHHESAMEPVSVEQGQRSSVVITLRAQPVRVRIEAPSGSRLSVDATPVSSGITLRLAPGTHQLRMELPGHEAVSRTIELSPGEEERVISMEAPIPEDERCRVALETNVQAVILVDGRPRSEGRVHEFGARSGEHELRVEADGYLSYTTTLDLAEGAPTRLQVELAPDLSAGAARLHRARIWSGVSTGILAGGMVVAMVIAGSAFDDWDTAAAQYEETGEEGDRLRAMEAANDLDRANLIADVALGLTAAAAITTIVLVSVGAGDAEERQSEATIAISPTTGGAMLIATVPTDGWGRP